MKNISKAILQVMNEVKSIDKAMTVGMGNYAYKGVADKDVKLVIGQAMQKAGLVILPTSIEPNIQIDRWEENGKQKQSVMTEVRTKYLLLHESGESIEISGYGHGIDSQDKAAGKATTYALKYALLYAFLVPTGNIDDTDNQHSEEKPTPPEKPWLNKQDFDKARDFLAKGGNIEVIKKKYRISKEMMDNLNTVINQL
jgi:hypothetical protein